MRLPMYIMRSNIFNFISPNGSNQEIKDNNDDDDDDDDDDDTTKEKKKKIHYKIPSSQV